MEVIVANVSVLQGGDIVKQMKDARKELEKILGSDRHIVVLPTTGDTSVQILEVSDPKSIVDPNVSTTEKTLLKD